MIVFVIVMVAVAGFGQESKAGKEGLKHLEATSTRLTRLSKNLKSHLVPHVYSPLQNLPVFTTVESI